MKAQVTSVKLSEKSLTTIDTEELHGKDRYVRTMNVVKEGEKYLVVSSDEYPQPVTYDIPPRHSGDLPARHSGELFSVRRSAEQFQVGGANSLSSSPSLSFAEPRRSSPPPRPPKTPLQEGIKPSGLTGMPTTKLPRLPTGGALPYPDDDGPPPMVNKATKPDFSR